MVCLRSLSLLVLASLAVEQVSGMYESNSAVKRLTAANFDRVVSRTSQPTFVKFYAPWCSWCQKLEPEYERAAKRTRGIAQFYAVDCDDDKNKALCARYNVEGFPTLKVLTEKRTKRGSRRQVDYQGERKASAMAKFARSMLPNLSKKLSSDGLDAFITTGQLPSAVLLTTRTKASDLWRGVAARLDRQVQFAHISHPDKQTLERLRVSTLPAMVVFPKPTDLSTFEVYSGEAKYLPIAKFIHMVAVVQKHRPQEKKHDMSNTLEVGLIEVQADLERLCIEPADTSPIPVLCVVGILPLESEYEESRAEHALSIKELESVLALQRLRSPQVQPTSANNDAADDTNELEEHGNFGNEGQRSAPFRVAWVNALGAAGERVRKLFNLSDDLPAVVAISPRKSAFAAYRGPFAGAEILEWAEACYHGRGMRRFDFELSIADRLAAHDEL
ncbi:hypothetical protein H4S08_000145 [Coemansia sp. RSA 1365]|nr:hypothetical protein H4S08_000145 [Coemansia sp. RSA 1365]